VDELASLSVPRDDDFLCSQDSSDVYALSGSPLPSGAQVEAFLIDLGLVLQLPSQERNAPEGFLGPALGWALEAALRAARFIKEWSYLPLPATSRLIFLHLDQLKLEQSRNVRPMNQDQEFWIPSQADLTATDLSNAATATSDLSNAATASADLSKAATATADVPLAFPDWQHCNHHSSIYDSSGTSSGAFSQQEVPLNWAAFESSLVLSSYGSINEYL
jgi:hypothetical protein